MAQPAGVAGVAHPLVVTRRGVTSGDLRAHDPLGFGLTQAAPPSLSRAKARGSARDMRAAGARGRGPWGNGLGVVDRGEGRAQRRRRDHVPRPQRFTERQLQPLPHRAAAHTGNHMAAAALGRQRLRPWGGSGCGPGVHGTAGTADRRNVTLPSSHG